MIMTQENKDILLRDICGRLPYGVKTKVNVNQELARLLKPIFIGEDGEYSYMCPSIISINEDNIKYVFSGLFECKPLLFPLSSMTEEQKEEYRKVCELDTEILSKHPMDGTPFPVLYNSQDWFNKNHFDYRGLIPMGMALDATALNIY